MTNLKRRQALQAVAVGAGTLALHRPSWAAADPDVIIMGAGLAGLTAALQLEAFGFRVRVLEASNRIGVQLRHLDNWNLRRRLLAARYDELLAGTPATTPPVAPGNEHVYHLYVVRSQQRDALQAHLAAHGIATT